MDFCFSGSQIFEEWQHMPADETVTFWLIALTLFLPLPCRLASGHGVIMAKHDLVAPSGVQQLFDNLGPLFP